MTIPTSSTRLALASVLATWLVACRSNGVYLEQPVGETHRLTSATGGAKPTGTDDPSAPIVVSIDEALAKKCKVDPKAAESQFKVADSKLRPVGDDVLATIGKCLAVEPDGALVVVGHTDPRGEDDYTKKLGLLRADRARAAVVAQGLPAERIAISSRGALDAQGTDEATWKADRRVELFLAEPRIEAGLDMPQYGPGPGAAPSASAPAAATTAPAAVGNTGRRTLPRSVSRTPTTTNSK